jgi:hypothetical protein
MKNGLTRHKDVKGHATIITSKKLATRSERQKMCRSSLDSYRTINSKNLLPPFTRR